VLHDAALHDALLRELSAGPDGAWVTCAGNSMEPTIRRGERVRVRACGRARAGQVVLFRARRGGYVLHRVLLVLPGSGWFAHIGDAGSGDGPGLAHQSWVVGTAAVSHRPPTPGQRAAACWRFVRGAQRRVRRRWRERLATS